MCVCVCERERVCRACACVRACAYLRVCLYVRAPVLRAYARVRACDCMCVLHMFACACLQCIYTI